MRIVGDFPHPKYKITILHHNSKYTIQVESGSLTQSYILREGEGIETIDDIKNRISSKFIQSLDRIFLNMSDELLGLLQDERNDEDEDLVTGVI